MTSNSEAAPIKVTPWMALPGFKESYPGILAIVIIAVFCGVPGIPWPFTIHNLLGYIDHVLPPIYGKGLFLDLLHFNYVVIGLACGIIIKNVFGVPKSWETGTTFTGVFLHTAIIMLGSQYMLRDMVKLGFTTVVIMVVFVFGSSVLLVSMGKLFKLDNRLNGIMAAGFAMCGVTAAVATAPMVKAKSDQLTYVIACSVSFGIICMIGLPPLCRLLEVTQYSFGVLSATGVPNSAQVIATGFMYGFEGGKVAGFVNIGRVVLIPLGALFIYFMTTASEIVGAKEDISIWGTIKEKFPVYVFGFAFIWTLNTMHLFPKPAVFAMEKVMIWFFTLSFIGLGLQTNLADVKKAGLKGMMVGYAAGSIKLILALVVIVVLMRMGYMD
jgi:uncharacterized integral membrane protein (TIGR00698 family)